MLEGLRGEDSIAELCRREGIAQSLYYKWSKEFLEAGKARLTGDTKRQATSDEVRGDGSAAGKRAAQTSGCRAGTEKCDCYGQRVGRLMRYTQGGKLEIIRLMEQADASVKQVLAELGIAHSTFYDWYCRFATDGYDGLADHRSESRRFWNRIPDAVREQVMQIALERPELSPRELAGVSDRQRQRQVRPSDETGQ